MYRITSAEDVAFARLCAVMGAAFSDYVVPMQPTLKQFSFMMAQRSFAPDLSTLLWQDDELVGLWLTGRRGAQAYLITSGIHPEHRGGGRARQMAGQSDAVLRGAGLSRLTTEVIEENAKARALYKRLGYERRRALDCYAVEDVGAHDVDGVSIRPIGWSVCAATSKAWRDWPPSWQNADEAIAAIEDDAVILGAFSGDTFCGFAVGFEPTQALAQIAIAPDMRRRGIGRALMAALAKEMHGPLKVINAEADDVGFRGFMLALGARSTISQHELTYAL